MSMLKQLTINVPLVEALGQMSRYAKFMKDLLIKKRAVSYEPVDNLHHCSAIATRSLVQKKADPGGFTIPCTVGYFNFAKALCDLEASVHLMPLAIYKQLVLGDPTLTNMWLLMANRLLKWPVGVLYVVLVKMNDEVVHFNVCKSIKQPKEMNVFSIVDIYYEEELELCLEEKFTYSYALKKLDLDLKNRPSPPVKPSIKEPPMLDLKKLPSHLWFVFFSSGNTLPVIIAADLSE
ncbi:uncharacterized protein LOC124888930 [Capsicum annuum]|uniref:uncharacterized protein LOC124888930 n=1 Tax=Capsicum annuum TaxID=4072 RepID=UPI001FB08862|nr:uncharacterized protein LOC124888930 [Capsicum annuum]